MAWDWGEAAKGFVGAGNAPIGGLVGAVYQGLGGGKDDRPWWESAKDRLGLTAKGYEYDPEAFRDPYRDENRARLDDEIAAAKNRDVGGAFRTGQLDLAQALAAQARGEGPSLAQEQLRQATDRNMAQALGMAASTQGSNPALAMRNVAQQRAGMAQEAAGQSAVTRLNEQMQAQQQLANVLGSGRGQDIQTQQLTDQLVSKYLMAGMDLDRAQWAANMELERLKGQQAQNLAIANQQANQKLLGTALNFGGSLLGMGATG